MIRFLAALALLAVPSPAMADILADMAGNWRGGGWGRETVSAPKQPVRCRLYAVHDGNDGVLTLDGLCSLAGRRFPIKGEMRTTPFGAIAATLNNPAGAGMIEASGTAAADRLALSFEATAPDTNRPVPQEMLWTARDDTLTLSISRKDGAGAELISVEFRGL